MKGYFASKPLDLDEVRDAIGVNQRAGYKPTPIHPTATVALDARMHTIFSKAMLENWDFLNPYRKTVFKNDGTADCVLVQADGRPTLAVCMEGFSYARYVALVLEEETPPSDTQKGGAAWP